MAEKDKIKEEYRTILQGVYRKLIHGERGVIEAEVDRRFIEQGLAYAKLTYHDLHPGSGQESKSIKNAIDQAVREAHLKEARELFKRLLSGEQPKGPFASPEDMALQMKRHLAISIHPATALLPPEKELLERADMEGKMIVTHDHKRPQFNFIDIEILIQKAVSNIHLNAALDESEALSSNAHDSAFYRPSKTILETIRRELSKVRLFPNDTETQHIMEGITKDMEARGRHRDITHARACYACLCSGSDEYGPPGQLQREIREIMEDNNLELTVLAEDQTHQQIQVNLAFPPNVPHKDFAAILPEKTPLAGVKHVGGESLLADYTPAKPPIFKGPER